MSFKPSITRFFFTNALPTLLAIHVLSADSISILNITFTVSGTITWSIEPWDILFHVSMLVWIPKVRYDYLVICSHFPLKANCIPFFGIGCNFPGILVLCLYAILPWYFVVYDRLSHFPLKEAIFLYFWAMLLWLEVNQKS